jgi:hypothetical protein
MTNCTREIISFPALNRRKIEAEFSGGDITSDGGVLLLRQMDKQLGLMESINHILHDPREQDQVTHSQLSLLRQRVYGLCIGYEDLNDHKTLRTDPAIQTALNRDDVLASQSTLCRLENRTDRRAMVAIHKVFLNSLSPHLKNHPKN